MSLFMYMYNLYFTHPIKENAVKKKEMPKEKMEEKKDHKKEKMKDKKKK